jgi:RNA polymerase sigma-70 factor (ECF subfamily)
MTDQEWLAERFEEHRSRLGAVAYRMLGSPAQADDAVQEAWLRLSRTDANTVHNLGGWLTTVVGRVCLDMLRSRAVRSEEPLTDEEFELVSCPTDEADPEDEVLIAESVGLALLVVLDALTPAERLAFVLHDMFAVPFDEIGSILDRSPKAAKQLASRARHRVQSADTWPDTNAARQTDLVKAFLSASRRGDFDALLEVLHPDVVLRADPTAVEAGAQVEVGGAPAVAKQFVERAVETLPTLVVETPRIIWATSSGVPRAAFCFTVERQKIVHIDLVFDPWRLRSLPA